MALHQDVSKLAQALSEITILADMNRDLGASYASETDLAIDVLAGTAPATVLDDADVRSALHFLRGGK